MSKRRKQTRPGDASAPARDKVAKDTVAKDKVRDIFVVRPFEGLRDEADWVALRELVPAATAPLRLVPELIDKYSDREVIVSTVLPMAWPALTKPDGRIFLGLQRGIQSGDVSRDLALSLLLALESEPGGPVTVPALPGPGPRLRGCRTSPRTVPWTSRCGTPLTSGWTPTPRNRTSRRPLSGPTRRFFRP